MSLCLTAISCQSGISGTFSPITTILAPHTFIQQCFDLSDPSLEANEQYSDLRVIFKVLVEHENLSSSPWLPAMAAAHVMQISLRWFDCESGEPGKLATKAERAEAGDGGDTVKDCICIFWERLSIAAQKHDLLGISKDFVDLRMVFRLEDWLQPSAVKSTLR